MPRYHNINGEIVQFTAEEETARDAEEQAFADGDLIRLQRLCDGCAFKLQISAKFGCLYNQVLEHRIIGNDAAFDLRPIQTDGGLKNRTAEIKLPDPNMAKVQFAHKGAGDELKMAVACAPTYGCRVRKDHVFNAIDGPLAKRGGGLLLEVALLFELVLPPLLLLLRLPLPPLILFLRPLLQGLLLRGARGRCAVRGHPLGPLRIVLELVKEALLSQPFQELVVLRRQEHRLLHEHVEGLLVRALLVVHVVRIHDGFQSSLRRTPQVSFQDGESSLHEGYRKLEPEGPGTRFHLELDVRVGAPKDEPHDLARSQQPVGDLDSARPGQRLGHLGNERLHFRGVLVEQRHHLLGRGALRASEAKRRSLALEVSAHL